MNQNVKQTQTQMYDKLFGVTQDSKIAFLLFFEIREISLLLEFEGEFIRMNIHQLSEILRYFLVALVSSLVPGKSIFGLYLFYKYTFSAV